MDGLALIGYRDAELLRQAIAGKVRRFTYSTAVTTCAALAAIQATISIESVSDFQCDRLTGRVFYAGGNDVDRAVDWEVDPMPRLELIDAGSGATLFDRTDVSFKNIWGRATDPLELPQPHTFAARSLVTVIFVNIAAVAMRFQVSLHGYKLYRE
jgi:hypothetical protein